jgi:ADP-ribose pyrophosphatase
MTMKTLGAGRFLRLVDQDGWEYVERTNASGVVAIAAVTTDERFLVVEQLRRPVGQPVIELTAGLAGDTAGSTDERLSVAVRRELLEETGYEVPAGDENLVLLLRGPSSAGLTSEIVTIFGARNVRKVAEGGGVDGENITVHAPLVQEAEAWLAARANQGTLIDPKIFVGLQYALRGGGERR